MQGRLPHDLPGGKPFRRAGGESFEREDGEQSPLAEDGLKDQRRPEDRQRVEEEKEERHGPVPQRVRMQGGADAQGKGQKIGQENGQKIQTERDGEPFQNQFGDPASLVHGHGRAEIAPERPPGPQGESDQKRFIHIQFLLDDPVASQRAFITGKRFGRAVARSCGEDRAFGRIARRQTHQDVAGEQDHQKRQRAQRQPFQQIRQKAVRHDRSSADVRRAVFPVFVIFRRFLSDFSAFPA